MPSTAAAGGINLSGSPSVLFAWMQFHPQILHSCNIWGWNFITPAMDIHLKHSLHALTFLIGQRMQRYKLVPCLTHTMFLMWPKLHMQIGRVHTVLINFTFLGVAVHYLDEANLPHWLSWRCLSFRRQRVGYCPKRSGKSFLKMCHTLLPSHEKYVWLSLDLYCSSCSSKDFCLDQ